MNVGVGICYYLHLLLKEYTFEFKLENQKKENETKQIEGTFVLNVMLERSNEPGVIPTGWHEENSPFSLLASYVCAITVCQLVIEVALSMQTHCQQLA